VEAGPRSGRSGATLGRAIAPVRGCLAHPVFETAIRDAAAQNLVSAFGLFRIRSRSGVGKDIARRFVAADCLGRLCAVFVSKPDSGWQGPVRPLRRKHAGSKEPPLAY